LIDFVPFFLLVKIVHASKPAVFMFYSLSATMPFWSLIGLLTVSVK